MAVLPTAAHAPLRTRARMSRVKFGARPCDYYYYYYYCCYYYYHYYYYINYYYYY